jgi:hypothetical protein
VTKNELGGSVSAKNKILGGFVRTGYKNSKKFDEESYSAIVKSLVEACILFEGGFITQLFPRWLFAVRRVCV